MRTIHRDIVGAFIFSSDNKILLGLSIKGGVYKEQWIVPGGGIEDGEEKIDAVKREVLEEVGIDIEDEVIKMLDGCPFEGESDKVLRDTGEKVHVRMKFYDYRVSLSRPSDQVKIKLEDDLREARWFTSEDLQHVELSPPTKSLLELINFI